MNDTLKAMAMLGEAQDILAMVLVETPGRIKEHIYEAITEIELAMALLDELLESNSD